jgi:hypothetical protein
MGGHHKFAYKALNHTTPWFALNHGLYCQIIMGDLCSSEILRSVEWQFPTNISGQIVGPTFKGQEIQKRQYCTIEVN